MKKLNGLLLCMLVLFQYKYTAQTISGIINNYAAVTNISGTGITVSSATSFIAGDRLLLIQMKGAAISTNNASDFGDISALGGAGTYEFATIASVAGNVITLAAAPTHTYNFTSGAVQAVTVPRYCTPTVNASLTCAQYNTSQRTGGVLAFEAGTLTLNANIDVSAKGFNGGRYAVSSFGCDNSTFTGLAGLDGGQKGESIAAYASGFDGAKGKLATGGGGANAGNSGGGGGANSGNGGFGGNQYSGCMAIDERGIGGVSISNGLSVLFMGGGGGGGYQDNNLTCTPGGNGGGIVYIKANVIIANNAVITANGGSVTVLANAEGAGGGGAGGSIFLACNNVSGTLHITTDGGSGGSNNNTVFPVDCHGTGGGGGGGFFAYSTAALPQGTTYSSLGGPAGTVNNSQSSCYNTTNGATSGSGGTSISGLQTALLPLIIPTLSITQSDTAICRQQSVTLTAGGAASYSWSTGSTNTTIVVAPLSPRSFTLTGSGSGGNSCRVSSETFVNVYNCTGISGINGNREALNIYPNPTTGKLFVETTTTCTFILYDALGKELIKTTVPPGEQMLDLSVYPSGVYLLKSMDETGIKKINIIKAE